MDMLHNLPHWLKVRACAVKLTDTYTRIIKALADEPDEFLFISVQEFAAKTDVSPASVTRFVRVLGYDSYAAFQQDLKEHIFVPQDSDTMLNYLDSSSGTSSNLLRRTYEAESEELERNLRLIDPVTLNEAAQLTARAENVYLVGLGASVALLSFMQHRLLQIGLNVTDMTQLSGLSMLSEYSVHIDSQRDVIISLSFWGIYSTIGHLLRYAKAFGIQSIAFSENQQSEISRLSTYSIPIKRAVINEFHSLSVPLSILNLFTMEVAKHKTLSRPAITKRMLWFKKYNESRSR